MTSFEHVVKKEESTKRIDKLLTDIYPAQSRTQIQKSLKNQLVTVNDQAIKSNYKCQKGDIIKGTFHEVKQLPIHPENIPLAIVYEDIDLLVVNKPRGMVVHPTAKHQNKTLVHALLHHCNHLSEIGGVERPGIVHRIDKDTSGLLVVAKNDQTHIDLAEQLVERKIERSYEAIVHGVIEPEHGLIDAPIARDPNHRLRMGVVDHGKPAVTHFSVLRRYDGFTHVKCQLETGRTHQIRVHMNYINHPLVGDSKYNLQKTIDINGQALYAKELGFTHPGKNEWMHFEVEQPTFFQKTLEKFKEKT